MIKNKSFNNSGMVIFIVFGIITLALIGIFAFSSLWKSQIHYEEQFVLYSLGRNLAETAVTYTHAFLQNKINDSSSNFGEKITKEIIDLSTSGGSKDISHLITSSSDFDISGLKDIISTTKNPIKGGTPYKFEKSFIKIEVSDLKTILSNNVVKSKDRIGVLKISAHVECDGRIISHMMKTRLKIVNVQIPVLSKFTLAVFDLPSGKGSNYYNQSLVDVNGNIINKSPYVFPLILDNSTTDRDLNSGGWVFLGASNMRKIILRLAAGLSRLGEMFHIFNPTIGMPPPAFTMARSQPLEDPTRVFPQYAMYLAIIGNYWGFYDKMNDEHFGVFNRYFQGSSKKYAPCCSCFRLYGTKSKPSRTLIVGNVKQSIPYYSILAKTNETTGYGELPIVMLKNVESYNFKHGFINCFPILDPSGSGNMINGDKILNIFLYFNAPPSMGVPSVVRPDYMFNYTYEIYKYYMSDYQEYPYNWNYEYMEYNSNGFDPNQYVHPKTFKSTSYTPDYSNFRMVNPNSGQKYFDGNLRNFSGKIGKLREILESKKIVEFNNQNSFYKETLITSSRLKIPGVVFIKNGPLTIKKNYDLEKSGIIVVRNGDIIIKSPLTQKNSGILTLVTLNGNIIIDSSSIITASLVATTSVIHGNSKGNIISSSPVNIKGNMICERYIPKNMKYGGHLKYDNRLDPYLHSDLRLYLEDKDLRFSDIGGVSP